MSLKEGFIFIEVFPKNNKIQVKNDFQEQFLGKGKSNSNIKTIIFIYCFNIKTINNIDFLFLITTEFIRQKMWEYNCNDQQLHECQFFTTSLQYVKCYLFYLHIIMINVT